MKDLIVDESLEMERVYRAMAPKHRYAIACLLGVLLFGSYAAIYRAGEVAGESRAVPIVVNEVTPVPPPPSAVPQSAAPESSHRSHSGIPGRPDKLRSPGDGTVDVNTAPAQELERLPGVGPKMAAKIIDYRSQVGGFRNADDLTNVSGIGDKKLAKMEPFLRF